MIKLIIPIFFISAFAACKSSQTTKEQNIITEPEPETVELVEEDPVDYSNWNCDSIIEEFNDPGYSDSYSKYTLAEYYRCLNWSAGGKYDSLISEIENFWGLKVEGEMFIAILPDPNDDRFWGDHLLLDSDLNVLYRATRIIRFYNDYSFVTDELSVRDDYYNYAFKRRIARYIDTQYMMIDKTGKIINTQKYIEPTYIDKGYFKVGAINIPNDTTGAIKYGLLDSLGNIAIPIKYSSLIINCENSKLLGAIQIAKNKYKWWQLNFNNETLRPYKEGTEKELESAIEMFEK